ncbi:hypothetical protein [Sphingobium cupriresistens]|uniref:hypothetical protein n=1 Tax=Sphingobium cupriresistens TaxID=1132417 RepID=UPI003BADDDBE
MVSFATGLGSFATGMTQGMQMAQQVKGAIDDRKMRKIAKDGTQAATAAREADIAGAIQTTANADGSSSYSVGGKAQASMDDARKAATSQVGSVMDYYRSTTVPKLIQGYIDVGRPEQASQLESWMESQDSAKLTKDWAKSMRLAMMGDTGGAMRGFGKLFERMEPGSKYMGTEDITEPVYEDMKLPKTGETVQMQTGTRPAGLRLKLRNADGEDVSHDFGGQEDLFRTAMFTLSPDKFAERAFAENDRAQASRAASVKADRDFRQDISRDKFKATLDDQRDQRQHERTVQRSDRDFAQQTNRDATQHGYRMDESTTELQMRAALKLSEDGNEKPEDVRKSLETITKRLAETDLSFSKLTPEEQTSRAVQVLQGQRSSARGVMSGSPDRDNGKGAIPKLW